VWRFRGVNHIGLTCLDTRVIEGTSGSRQAWFHVAATVEKREFIMSVRAAVLSAGMLLAISFWGLAVYTDGAMAGKVPTDGYGISAGTMASVR